MQIHPSHPHGANGPVPDGPTPARTSGAPTFLSAPAGRLELWGGVECSVLRARTGRRDQVRETGHHDRPGDLDLVASLGVRRLRYPVLWERVAPGPDGVCDWDWTDRRLGRLRALGIAPIAGLVHHGSGPDHLPFTDPGFPEGLADFAARAAERYPWVEDWTPVNEPLTTARFSGLYGHWWPNHRNRGSFLRILANEVRGTALAMRAIRRAIPGARLIQTEDLGRVFSTTRLAGQAAFENERRWLSLDLLCGRVGRDHPWRGDMRAAGVSERHLDEMAMEPAMPDVIGINHYITSDRFLDHRAERYLPHIYKRRENGLVYADVEAARMRVPAALTGFGPRLREAWDRYGLPVAVTEAHLGCREPEESVRWLLETWAAASGLRLEGADVRAVTVWSLFGAVDWSSLLRRREGRYEPGIFDARHDPPQPTLLAAAVRGLAMGDGARPAAETGPGWWRRPDRFMLPSAPTSARARAGRE